MSLNKADLIKWFEDGCKPKNLFRIGTEHEKFVYKLDTLKPVSYNEASGIKNILKSKNYKGGCARNKNSLTKRIYNLYNKPS